VEYFGQWNILGSGIFWAVRYLVVVVVCEITCPAKISSGGHYAAKNSTNAVVVVVVVML
jgi:hypothetical protein